MVVSTYGTVRQNFNLVERHSTLFKILDLVYVTLFQATTPAPGRSKVIRSGSSHGALTADAFCGASLQCEQPSFTGQRAKRDGRGVDSEAFRECACVAYC
jgi:hypothetical protein